MARVPGRDIRWSRSVKYSLVIPCFNEAKGLALLIERCRALLEAAPDAEILLVDNGSTDETPQILNSLTAHERLRSLRVEPNRGYGGGIMAGLDAARGDIIGWTHADMQTDPLDALKAFRLFEESAAPERLFVKGRRYGRPLSDRLFTAAMSAFETLLLGQAMHDINAQPTLFHRSFHAGWQNGPKDFSLDLFAYYLARRSRFSVARIRVRFHRRAFGVSHWNINWQAKRRFIRRTIDFSLQLRRRVASHD